MLLKLNVPVDRLEDVVAALPAMTSPTVMPLAHGDLRAVETVVPKLGIKTRRDFGNAPGKRKSLIDVGIVSEYYLSYTTSGGESVRCEM